MPEPLMGLLRPGPHRVPTGPLNIKTWVFLYLYLFFFFFSFCNFSNKNKFSLLKGPSRPPWGPGPYTQYRVYRPLHAPDPETRNLQKSRYVAQSTLLLTQNNYKSLKRKKDLPKCSFEVYIGSISFCFTYDRFGEIVGYSTASRASDGISVMIRHQPSECDLRQLDATPQSRIHETSRC